MIRDQKVEFSVEEGQNGLQTAKVDLLIGKEDPLSFAA
ncbi:MAG: cold shock domain-containing protein [Anaerolineaceae bacterium]|nr:cold shock domain-containing protein [Anaerolineaceae bacterium]